MVAKGTFTVDPVAPLITVPLSFHEMVTGSVVFGATVYCFVSPEVPVVGPEVVIGGAG